MKIHVLWSADRPSRRLTSYSTIGLSDHPMAMGEGEFPTRIELAGAFKSTDRKFLNVLGSAAFGIMRSDKVYHPGTVMPDYVKEYFPSTKLPHLYLTAPFLWDLKTLDCGTKKVSWLLGMPISQSEAEYLRRHGDEKLEDQLEKQEVDIFDIGRPSVV